MTSQGIETRVGDAYPRLEKRSTAVYRVCDAKKRLLYVGLSKSPLRRAAQHAESKNWWMDVARIDVVWFATRAQAEVAERAAIESEHPMHNIRHARTAPSTKRKDIIILAPRDQEWMGDSCRSCVRAGVFSEIHYPSRLQIRWEKNAVDCAYACDACGAAWRCGYTLGLLLTMRGHEVVPLCLRDDVEWTKSLRWVAGI